MADILLLENDEDYAAVVQAHLEALIDAYGLSVYLANDVSTASGICQERDIRVAIVDLSLSAGALGTDAITAIHDFDKKIIFIIHTIHGPQAIADWCVTNGIPYTSLFFLRKTGDQSGDSIALGALVSKALRSYVPHFPPALVSVRDVMEIINSFSEDHPSFRRTAIVSNIHRSQDALNAAGQWAADRLARAGFDSTRVAVAITGSFARLEASAASDADYFVAFDDSGLSPAALADALKVSYRAFVETGLWFERNRIPVHQFQLEEKQPNKIVWHASTLPTWFPLSTLFNARLGRSTQIELTKQWFLLESFPLFNPNLVRDMRERIAGQMAISSQQTIRDAVAHSSLPESFQLLVEEFESSFRHRLRDSLSTVKHFFMRLLNLFSVRLWLLRSFLDPSLFEASSSHLFEELSPHPLARVIQFHDFIRDGAVLHGKPQRQCISNLEVICNLYADAAHSFGLWALRAGPTDSGEVTLLNDLADSGRRCEESMLAVVQILAESPTVSTHPEIALRRIL